jgi:hypothetical protein
VYIWENTSGQQILNEMGTIDHGILGEVSGKTGPIVGARSRGQNTIRSTARKRRLKSDVPQSQTYKLGMMSSFLAGARSAINIGFAQTKKKLDPLNRAIRLNIPLAIIGRKPNYTIDFSKVVLSTGKREPAWSEDLVLETGCKATVSWEIPETVKLKAIGKDIAHLLVYDTTFKKFAFYTANAERASLSCTMNLNDTMNDHTIHVWIFFVSPDGKIASNSTYVGTGTVI